MAVSEFGDLWGGGAIYNMVFFNLHLKNRADHGES